MNITRCFKGEAQLQEEDSRGDLELKSMWSQKQLACIGPDCKQTK